MYWSAYGIIESADMDGQNRRTLALLKRYGDELYYGLGLALDIQLNRIYFVGQSDYPYALPIFYWEAIFYIDLGLEKLSVQMMEEVWSFKPIGLAVDDQYIYWGGTHDRARYSFVFRRDLDGGGLELVLNEVKNPRGIVVQKGNITRNS